MALRLHRNESGFTLSELLVVVAIIAVLVAIAIPVFIGSLESSKVAACQANRRSLKAAVSSAYMLDANRNLENAIQKGVESMDGAALEGGKVTGLCSESDGEYTVTLDESGSNITVTCSHKGHSDDSSPFDDKIGDITSALEDVFEKTSISAIDSEAPGNSNAAAIIKALQGQGINLTGYSWRAIRNNKGDGPVIQFTNQAIKDLKDGDPIVYIQYREDTKHYTVWHGTVKEVTTKEYGTYNTISGQSNQEGSKIPEEQTFANAWATLQELNGK